MSTSSTPNFTNPNSKQAQSNTKAGQPRADFAKLDFQTQAGLSLMPLFRSGVDIRKTSFAAAVPTGMLKAAAQESGFISQGNCGHDLDTNEGVCLTCHALYCATVDDDEDRLSLAEIELEEMQERAADDAAGQLETLSKKSDSGSEGK